MEGLSSDACRLLACIQVVGVARRQGFGSVYERNMKLARSIAAHIIAA
jgi:hypothetical protein